MVAFVNKNNHLEFIKLIFLNKLGDTFFAYVICCNCLEFGFGEIFISCFEDYLETVTDSAVKIKDDIHLVYYTKTPLTEGGVVQS